MAEAVAPAGLVPDAVRAGWLMAELRGRLRPDGPPLGGPSLDRVQHTLPLPSERSATEQIIQARRVLADLAGTFGALSSSTSAPTDYVRRRVRRR